MDMQSGRYPTHLSLANVPVFHTPAAAPLAPARAPCRKLCQLPLHHAQAARAVAALQAHLKLSADAEVWTTDFLKRHANVSRDGAAELRKITCKALEKQQQQQLQAPDANTLYNCLRSCQASAAEKAAGCSALEAYTRHTLLAPLERDGKIRNDKVKKRTKAVNDSLSRLELVEKVYARALSDAQDEQKRLSYLEDRRALDLAEEVEKVEIDLRKSVSQLQIKEAEWEMATLRMQEMHTYWGTEWESFRIFARHIDFERSAAVRTILIEYSHASIMAREGALKQEKAALDRLLALDVVIETESTVYFEGLEHLERSCKQPASPDDIASALWPETAMKTRITPEQLTTFMGLTLRKKPSLKLRSNAVDPIEQAPLQNQTGLARSSSGNGRKASLKRKPAPPTTNSILGGDLPYSNPLQPISPGALQQASVLAYPNDSHRKVSKPLPTIPPRYERSWTVSKGPQAGHTRHSREMPDYDAFDALSIYGGVMTDGLEMSYDVPQCVGEDLPAGGSDGTVAADIPKADSPTASTSIASAAASLYGTCGHIDTQAVLAKIPSRTSSRQADSMILEGPTSVQRLSMPTSPQKRSRIDAAVPVSPARMSQNRISQELLSATKPLLPLAAFPQAISEKEQQDLPPLPLTISAQPPTLAALPRISKFHVEEWDMTQSSEDEPVPPLPAVCS